MTRIWLAAMPAVGRSQKGTAQAAVAETWNGSAWHAQETAPATNKILEPVSCSAAHACTAVGVAPKGNKGRPIAEQE